MTIRIEDAVQQYITLRDEKERIDKEAKAKKLELDKKMEIIEKWFFIQGQETGTRSWKTDYGTIYFAPKVSVSVADWDEVVEYIKAFDAFDLLNHSVNKTAVTQYLEKNDALPPGVNYTRYEGLFARKPTKKA